jgi:hypothetical protein
MNTALPASVDFALSLDVENSSLKLGLVTLAHMAAGRRDVEISIAEFQRRCCFSTRRETEIALDWIQQSGMAKAINRDIRAGTITLRLMMGGGL